MMYALANRLGPVNGTTHMPPVRASVLLQWQYSFASPEMFLMVWVTRR